MCTMMQVQGSNMMDSMGGNPAAAFWGARHPSWPATSHASHQGSNATPNQDPKVAEKLMTELQVRFPPSSLCLDVLVLSIVIRRLSSLVLDINPLQHMGQKYAVQYLSTQQCFVRTLLAVSQTYLIFVIFSPRAQFLAKFFSTQNRVNRTKTGFATKQRKLQKKLIWQQNIVKCNKTP